MQTIVIGLLAVNAVAAAVTAADKICARRGMRRVPERTLWILAVCGGAIGMYVTMCLVRHKTKHRQFMVGLPLLIVLQAVLILLCLFDKKITM